MAPGTAHSYGLNDASNAAFHGQPASYQQESYIEEDTASDRSTVVYGHEPFSTFRHRVHDLAARVFWPEATREQVVVEYMTGGGNNRVIGVSRCHMVNGTKEWIKIVVRVPRSEDGIIGWDAACLKFVSQHTTIPVPAVLLLDETTNNELHAPFMVQRRVEGFNAATYYHELSHAQRCEAATELGAIVKTMIEIQSPCPGSWDLEGDALIFHPLLESTDNHAVSVGDFFAQMLAKDQRKHIEAGDTQKAQQWTELMKINADLDFWGFLSGGYSLVHRDFEARNILLRPVHNPGSSTEPVVASVLDWDTAIMAPTFITCKPPRWIWRVDFDIPEGSSADKPSTAQNQELKRLFEEAAGETYMRFAYGPHNLLARKLAQFVTMHFMDEEHIQDDFTEHWQAWSNLAQSKANKMQID